MQILCNLAHMRNDMVPSSLIMEHVICFSKLVSKYDCALLCRFAGSSWMAQQDEVMKQSLANSLALTVAAYDFQDQVFFPQVYSIRGS